MMIEEICDYTDSHRSKIWQGCTAAPTAAYAKEILSLISAASRKISPTTAIDSSVAIILDALHLARPDVDRGSLIALKGRRAEGTCDWIVRHPCYRHWLEGNETPLLRVLERPRKERRCWPYFSWKTCSQLLTQQMMFSLTTKPLTGVGGRARQLQF